MPKREKYLIEQFEHTHRKRKSNPPLVGLVAPSTDRDEGEIGV